MRCRYTFHLFSLVGIFSGTVVINRRYTNVQHVFGHVQEWIILSIEYSTMGLLVSHQTVIRGGKWWWDKTQVSKKSIIQFHNSLKDMFALNCIWIRSNIFYSEGYSDETVHHYLKCDFQRHTMCMYEYMYCICICWHQSPNTEWHRTLQKWLPHQGARSYFIYLFIYQILVQFPLAQFVAPHFFRATFGVGCNPAMHRPNCHNMSGQRVDYIQRAE